MLVAVCGGEVLKEISVDLVQKGDVLKVRTYSLLTMYTQFITYAVLTSILFGDPYNVSHFLRVKFEIVA